jgi:branched-subunit amino acid transport protein
MITVWEGVGVIAGLTLITLVSRGFFFLSQRELPLPAWLQQGLRYAPLAALTAVLAPEVLMTNGQLISTWQDARPYAVVAAAAWFFWRGGMFGTLITGLVVFLPLRIGLGW